MKLKILGPFGYTRGDTGPPLDLQILKDDGAAYSIPSGASVYAAIHDVSGEESFTRTCSVTDATNGKVQMSIGQFTWWYPIGEYLIRCHVQLTSGEIQSTEPQSLVLRGHYLQVIVGPEGNWAGKSGTPSNVISRTGYGRWSDGFLIDVSDQASDTNYGWIASSPLPVEVLGTRCTVQFWSYVERLQTGKVATVEFFTTKSESVTEGKTVLATINLSTTGQVSFSSQTVDVPSDAYKAWLELRLQAGGKVYFLEPAIVAGLPVPLG